MDGELLQQVISSCGRCRMIWCLMERLMGVITALNAALQSMLQRGPGGLQVGRLHEAGDLP